ncbi:SGNH hydrolase-type esterase domain containing protein [Trema orientale]|uniref:SGNH hydrolase-type esterase domain containing protein n=1 Tax=Trema orientale TaxID=63057 RepID=A0A2P5FMS4_TREOI|nr:SGNH hydrolase-type esterase domain containing protein [Trema orientale]
MTDSFLGPKKSQMAAAFGVVRMASLLYPSRACHFPAIYNFGDSNSDTGAVSVAFGRLPPPYGETFFGKPSGRYSDGRLIIDFIAKGSQITSNLPKPGDFSKALYTLDSGQNDLHYGLVKLTRKHLKESTSNIINQFSLSIEVVFVFL